jgi:FtsP/CotA-like multicopper oxidase with cupredoxin domain
MIAGLLLTQTLFTVILGATVEYQLVARRGSWRVDSARANTTAVLVNDQFPAPTLEAVVGDDVVVHVQNDLKEGTTVHFHGLLQRGTPHMDGVPFGTQCPIAPGQNFTYRFKADASGTFFYHAHVESHFADGFYGSFVVRGPSEPKENELTLLLSDWYHLSADEIMAKMSTPPFVTPLPDAVLVNGAGGENMAELRVQTNATYRIRIINAATFSLFRVSFESHNVSVVEADADRVSPLSTSFVEVDAGQRYIVLLTTGESNGIYAINVQMMHRVEPTPRGHAMLLVGGNDTPTPAPLRKRQHSHGSGHVPAPTSPSGAQIDEPFFERQLSAATEAALPAVTTRINITVQFSKSTGQWHINDLAMTHEATTPVLHAVLRGERVPTSVPTIALKHNDVVEIIWRNKRDTSGESEHHPMHVHGHRLWLLGSGTTGEPTYNIAVTKRPLVRDTFELPHADGWAITRFVADNPGVWLVHCHYAWHMASGMAFYFVYTPASTLPALPADTQRCDVALKNDMNRLQMQWQWHAAAVIVFCIVIVRQQY